ncbi:hypothetical protein BH09ACT6_BH09ACT6_00770 [soil metagenome]
MSSESDFSESDNPNSGEPANGSGGTVTRAPTRRAPARPRPGQVRPAQAGAGNSNPERGTGESDQEATSQPRAPRKPAQRKPAPRKPAQRQPAKATTAGRIAPSGSVQAESVQAESVQQETAREETAREKTAEEKAAHEISVSHGSEPEPEAGSPRLTDADEAANGTSVPEYVASPNEIDDDVDIVDVIESAFVSAEAADRDEIDRTDRLVEAQSRAEAFSAGLPNSSAEVGEDSVLSLTGVVKRFGATTAVAGIDLHVRRGAFYGIVGPNGAGKTTTLSMITGLVRPDEGIIQVNGLDVWKDVAAAKKTIGVLPDKLRLFDRLTGRQLLHYSGSLRGLTGQTVRDRTEELAEAFGIHDALGRLVSDYSAGMTKKLALAASMIHSPRLLVLDEPFEAVDPVSADTVTEILQRYVAYGGTVVLSSHSMDMIERVCDGVAIIVHGKVLSSGTVDEVSAGSTLEDRFIELAGGHKAVEGMEWLLSSFD